MDDWVLCRVRQKSNVLFPAKESHESDTRIVPHPDFGPFQEKEIMEKMNYLKNSELSVPDQEGEVVDEHMIFGINSEMQSPTILTMKAALSKIKRVLSIGAMDEQMPMSSPNKRLCTLSYSNLDKSSIFEFS